MSLLALLAGTVAAGFFALGTWQIERRSWKLALIERVDTRIHAVPAAVPGPESWSRISREADEYRRVRLEGRYLTGADTHVRGLTALGAGYWLLTPLRTPAGYIVLVNRGFVPDDPARTDASARGVDAATPVAVTGLLRLSEPNGRFLRDNLPAADRWYSRDVQAIARTRGLSDVAPFFIDIDVPPNPSAAPPVTGLTVTRFANNHLQYALTWFGLGAMVLAAAAFVGRHEYRLRQQA